MKRVRIEALVFWTSALLALLSTATATHDGKASYDHDHESELDDETDSDSAPFTVLVEHGSGQRCAGSLVSLRTALTSAWCVRGPNDGNPRELWALAPGVLSTPTPSRRVARVALVAGAEVDSPTPHLQPAWIGAALDIAVLELEAPFGGAARSRPILMATRVEDCGASTVCHVVRVRGRPPHLHIVDAALVSGETCGSAAPGWPALRDTAMCLTGPTLCSMDRGAGVVCDGKLCGVLSRSARSIGMMSHNHSLETMSVKEDQDPTCGNVHVALSVARMRRFLHCAHTLRACGSGGECSNQCSERQLMVLEAGDGASGGGAADTDVGPDNFYSSVQVTQETTTKISKRRFHNNDFGFIQPTSTVRRLVQQLMLKSEDTSPTNSFPPVTLKKIVTSAQQESSLRPNFEFEPNRADFKGAPERTTRVYLKAGEYGDNALDYGEVDESAMGGGGGGGGGGGITTTTPASMTTVQETASSDGHTTAVNGSLMGTSKQQTVPTHTDLTTTEMMVTSNMTRTSSKVEGRQIRISKLDAQVVANDTLQRHSRGFETPRSGAFMSFVVFLIPCFVI